MENAVTSSYNNVINLSTISQTVIKKIEDEALLNMTTNPTTPLLLDRILSLNTKMLMMKEFKQAVSCINCKNVIPLVPISFAKPHKPVSWDTISRWLNSLLESAAIDTSIFTAYSVRTASTSAAKSKGASMEQVLSAGGWSAASTFGKYYNKPIMKQLDNDYGAIVLKGKCTD